MAINWGLITELALVGLTETAQLAPVIGGEDHLTAAGQALQAAGQASSAVITDPTQLKEAQAAYSAAAAILNVIAAFQKKKA